MFRILPTIALFTISNINSERVMILSFVDIMLSLVSVYRVRKLCVEKLLILLLLHWGTYHIQYHIRF